MLEREFTRVIPADSSTGDLELESFSIVLNNKSILVKNFPFTIGTAEENHLILRDKFVSRYQCRISRDKNAYVLEDLNSTNGTHLDGEKIKKSRQNLTIFLHLFSKLFLINLSYFK